MSGVDLNHGALGPLSSAKLTSGRTFTASDATSNVAMVNANYASQKKLKVGSTVTVAKNSFKVIGIASAGSSASDVFIPLARAQKLASMTGKVNTIYVSANSASNISAVAKEISGLLPKATVTTSASLASEVTGSLSSAASLANNLGKWLAIAVLVAAFLLASLLTMAAVTRRVREFGTLKALGWRSRRIVGQVMGESIAIGIIGGVVGVALGFAGRDPGPEARQAADRVGRPDHRVGHPRRGADGRRRPVPRRRWRARRRWRLRPGRSGRRAHRGRAPHRAGHHRRRDPGRGAGHRRRPHRRHVRRLAGGPAAPRRGTVPGRVADRKPGETMYKLTGVTKKYQKGRVTVDALAGVDLVIEDGEWLAIQGPTGHGKTTLLQMLGGLDRPTSGIVDFDGQDLAADAGSSGHQGPGRVHRVHLPDLQPDPDAERAGERGGRPGPAGRARRPSGEHGPARRWPAWAWSDRQRHLPSELSGGQQQRVAIARALVKEPKVLLADEPTGNLDEGTRDEIMGLLEKLWREAGLTLVLVTHDSSVARRAQRIGIMQNGKLSIRPDTRGAAT